MCIRDSLFVFEKGRQVLQFAAQGQIFFYVHYVL